MELKVNVPEDKRHKFDYLARQFSSSVRGFLLSNPKLDPFTNRYFYIISLKNTSNYSFLIETLLMNGFNVSSKDELVNQKIKDAVIKIRESTISNQKVETPSLKRIGMDAPLLDTYFKDGNYQEVLKVAKDIRYSPETILKAKTGLTVAVNNFILKTIEKVDNFHIYLEEGIKLLLNVASNFELKNYNCSELMANAGIVAIDLCLKKKDAHHVLIEIANSRVYDNIIPIKAAIKFAEEILDDVEGNEINIQKCIKEMNIRYLINIFDSVSDKLNSEEKMYFDKLVKFIDNSRK